MFQAIKGLFRREKPKPYVPPTVEVPSHFVDGPAAGNSSTIKVQAHWTNVPVMKPLKDVSSISAAGFSTSSFEYTTYGIESVNLSCGVETEPAEDRVCLRKVGKLYGQEVYVKGDIYTATMVEEGIKQSINT